MIQHCSQFELGSIMTCQDGADPTIADICTTLYHSTYMLTLFLWAQHVLSLVYSLCCSSKRRSLRRHSRQERGTTPHCLWHLDSGSRQRTGPGPQI